MTFFQHTEANELLYYAVFGLIMACTPLLMSILAGPGTKIHPKRSPFLKYLPYLAFPIAIILFWTLLRPHWTDHVLLIESSVVVTAIAIFGFRESKKKLSLAEIPSIALIFVFTAIAVFFNLTTFYYNRHKDALSLPGGFWHHWGAFLSSAKSLAAGLAIYKDFPSQYGFGPSLLIATASHYFGWVSGMFYATSFMQLLYWASMTIIAINLVKKSNGNQYILMLFTLFITIFGCFFWVPGIEAFANIYPSLGGARYLPATLLVAALLSVNLTTNSFSKKKILYMHFFWAIGALWSIESAFYVCLIWWPYYLYIHLPNEGTPTEFIRNILTSIFKLLRVLSIFLVTVLSIYWIVYRTLPSPSIFTAYAQNVPGALLINFEGPFIFAASLFFIAFGSLIFIYKKHGKSDPFHYLFAITLLSYGAFSYYIGRSADANITPLVPFFSIILLAMCLPGFPKFIRFMSISILSLFICWVAVPEYEKRFNYSYMLEFRGNKLENDFANNWENPTTTDLGRAIEYITKTYNEPSVAIDPISSVTISGKQEQWNSYNNITSYIVLPTEVQKRLIYLSKKRLMKPGWVLLHKDLGFTERLFELFGESYDRKEALPFGAYTAYRFTPKPN